MTSHQFHIQKVVPLQLELIRLEEEYEKLLWQEHNEKIGDIACCDNCAKSCVIEVNEHNICRAGKCTCCYGWCPSWEAENEASAFLREHYHYNGEVYDRLEELLGSHFLAKCQTPEKAKVAMEALEFIKRIEEEDF